MKRLNFKIIGIVLLMLTSAFTQAQKPPSDEATEKIKTLQMQYLSQKLNLSADEAEKFWPVYKNYTKEVETLIAERHSRRQQDKITESDPDDLARRNMDNDLGYEKRMYDIRSRYTNEFQRVLPARKAGAVFKSEREFRNIMINHLNNQRLNRINQGGNFRKRP
ncbi:hypothetical protein [Chitinophaga qingshengii]|uniref:Sensor of ECF-type sigma factor n=1 Tax=Chitinophaga qingshengii TaxID=1569794 RepID=A0ABR7TNC6_9BACT|nr:hypothetical protein [Chitinophaga qingshengii]MBC9931135.1 hypothetical protein [Chitinophaga qingshengii]